MPAWAGSPGTPGPARADSPLRGAWVQLRFVCGGAASSRLSPGLLPGDAPSHRRLHEADPAATPLGATAALRAPDTVTA